MSFLFHTSGSVGGRGGQPPRSTRPEAPLKWERLKQWCLDASNHAPAGRKFYSLFVRQGAWEEHRPGNFAQLITACQGH